MGAVWFKAEGYYFRYSSVSDRCEPGVAMTRDEAVQHYLESAMEDAREQIDGILKHVDTHGTSDRFVRDDTPDAILLCNRIGERETRLTTKKAIAFYIARRDNPELKPPKGRD